LSIVITPKRQIPDLAAGTCGREAKTGDWAWNTANRNWSRINWDCSVVGVLLPGKVIAKLLCLEGSVQLIVFFAAIRESFGK